MDFLIELFLEIYMELMMLLVPEKNITKKHKIIATSLALFVLALVFGLIIFGVVLLVDYDNLWGILPLAFAVLISLVQIIAGIVLYKKNH